MYYSSSILALLFCCYVSSNVIHPRFVRQTDTNICTTPDESNGKCVPVAKCHSLYELLKTVHIMPTETEDYLKRYQCGKSGENKVCCDVYELTTKSKCGKSNRAPDRIVGGRNASLGDWPWISALGYVENGGTIEWKCGGSLLSDRWVLTAGHCVKTYGNMRLKNVRLGELHLDESVDDGASPEDFEIERAIVHPQYYRDHPVNDIALLKLKNPVNFTENIRPICLLNNDLHRSDSFYDTKELLVAGWGKLSWGGNSSKMLQETQVNIINQKNCAKMYEGLAQISAGMLCASKPGTDACQGDSGGPLMLPVGNSYYLAGVVSFGLQCAKPGYPGVYVSVAYYIDWIKNVTGLEW